MGSVMIQVHTKALHKGACAEVASGVLALLTVTDCRHQRCKLADMYNPHSAAAQRTGSAVPDEWLARRRTAQNRQEPVTFLMSAVSPRSFDMAFQEPGWQAARCTLRSKPPRGSRALACELCCLDMAAAAARLAAC